MPEWLTADVITQTRIRDYSALRQMVKGVHLRTHPELESASAKVMLVHADSITMDDGFRYDDWDRLVADIAAAGAGGLDTGSEAASVWYEIYGIRKSSDGTKNLLLHRAKEYKNRGEQLTDDGEHQLRTGATTNVKLGQGVKTASGGRLEFIDVKVKKNGTPTGNVWFTLESDSSGLPSGTVLATSDKIDVASVSTTAQFLRVVFRTPFSLTVTVQYHLVLQGDYTVHATNNLSWRADTTAAGYADGSKSAYNGTTWTADGDDDFVFTLRIAEQDTAVTMPSGYDQRAKLGYVYNDAGAAFVPFVQLDREVIPLATQASGTLTATVMQLTDLSAFLPPIPLMVRLVLAQSVAQAHVVYAGGVPDGFVGPSGNWRTGGLVQNYSLVGSTSLPTAYLDALLTELQGLYLAVSGNTGQVWVSSWRW